MAATREQFIYVNINFIYFEVNGFIGLGLSMIRAIYFMFRPFLAFLRPKYKKSINLLTY